MRNEEPDRQLRRLHEVSERVAANLVELEIDSSRQLLEVSSLTGESAARWSAASAALTDLWRWKELLDKLLAQADRLRSPRRATELSSLLEGQSIELTRSEVPLAERDLLGSSQVAVRCSADELLERMSRAFDEVKSVVARFGEAWETLSPRLGAARRLADQATTLADQLGEPDRDDLDAATRSLSRLAAALSADPLSVRASDVDRLTQSLEAICGDLGASTTLRTELDARVAVARALLARLRTTITDADAAHEEWLVKISVPAARRAFEPGENLDDELTEIGTVARSGAWREARRRLDGWTARASAQLDDANRALRESRAPLQARNQLRALLEAYQVKAERIGLIEDPRLEQVFAQAHEALYTAPTDLAFAAQLVRRYQELLNTEQQSTKEATP